MSTKRKLNLKLGNVILVNNSLIGVIRHIGYVNGLSNGKHDRYIGIEIKHQKENKTDEQTETIGIVTNGSFCNHYYFDTISADKGRFIKEHMVTKQFSHEELFDQISDPNTLIPISAIPMPMPMPMPINDTLLIMTKRFDTFCSKPEIDHFIAFCNDEEFKALDDIIDDLSVYEGGDSAIIDAIKKKFNWTQHKVDTFVNLALEREEKTKEETKYALPLVSDFYVPIDLMRKRDERSINDIVLCLKKNKSIPSNAIATFKQFCNRNKICFADLCTEKSYLKVKNSFKKEHRELYIFMDYVEKGIYELSPPVLKTCKFTKKDEDNKHRYFEQQCRGVIKHDRDLLQYFCILENTEPDLPSELIDIADRIAIEEKQELNIQQFGAKYFFANCDKVQISKVKAGLRKYHNRFLPLFPKTPLKLIADKVSAYQKYAILLSEVVSHLCEHSPSIIPFMIDLMIIPPGVFNKIEDQNTKTYDAEGTKNIGDIPERLRAFDIPIRQTRGLSANSDNFDSAITVIIEYIKQITNNFTTKNQRICILVDRRWRINCKRFDAFNKLLKCSDNSSSTSTSATPGWGWKGSKGKNRNSDFYNHKYDSVYVYQPNLSKHKKTSFHEFNSDYCHETLIYLTKQCIIPIKDHYMHIGGDTTDGWLWSISAHIQMPKNKLWYKYEQRWYVFLQSSALRFFSTDMDILWGKYFVDADMDPDRLTSEQIRNMFKINLRETDSSYKRWYYAVKRS